MKRKTAMYNNILLNINTEGFETELLETINEIADVLQCRPTNTFSIEIVRCLFSALANEVLLSDYLINSTSTALFSSLYNDVYRYSGSFIKEMIKGIINKTIANSNILEEYNFDNSEIIINVGLSFNTVHLFLNKEAYTR
jgi:hypothetical protein